jgi:hypothetical protein
MFQVTSMNKNLINFFLIIIIFSSSYSSAYDDIKIDKLSLVSETLDPIANKRFFFDKIYNGKNELINIINPEESSTNIKNISPGDTFFLDKGMFIKVAGNDNIKKLFNGSIIIKFKSIPDLQNYATLNEIELITDLSQIQRGIFKVRNLYELAIKIDNIKADKNVLEIELQTLNPNLKPE